MAVISIPIATISGTDDPRTTRFLLCDEGGASPFEMRLLASAVVGQ